MAEYVYSFGILKTGEKILELPCSGVSMDMAFNSAGTWRGTFYLDSTGIDNFDAMQATTPGLCYVVTERDGKPVWYGIVTAREYQSSAKVASLTARSLEYFATRQLIDVDLTYTTEDPRAIFADLWTTMQGTLGRDVGVTVPSIISNNDLTPTSLTVSKYDFKYFSNCMDDLSNGDDGFDYTIDVGKTSDGDYTHPLRIGNPNLGQLENASRLVFEYVDNNTGGGGNITQYWETESIGSAGTHVWAVGPGEGSSILIGKDDIANKYIANGNWDRYDIKVPTKGATDQGTLDAIARQEMIVRTPPMSVITCEMKANIDPVFGSFGLGDACLLSINDPKHPYPNHLNLATRIIGWSLTPESSDSTELVNLTFQNEDDSSGD